MIEWRRKKKNLSVGIFVRPLRKKAVFRFFEVWGAPRPPCYELCSLFLRQVILIFRFKKNLGKYLSILDNKLSFHQSEYFSVSIKLFVFSHYFPALALESVSNQLWQQMLPRYQSETYTCS